MFDLRMNKSENSVKCHLIIFISKSVSNIPFFFFLISEIQNIVKGA